MSVSQTVWAVIINYHGLYGSNNKHLFCTVLGTGKSKIRCQQIQCLRRACLLVYWWPSSHRILTCKTAESRASCLMSLFRRTPIPFRRVLPALASHLLNLMVVGVSTSTYSLAEDTSIQSMKTCDKYHFEVTIKIIPKKKKCKKILWGGFTNSWEKKRSKR